MRLLPFEVELSGTARPALSLLAVLAGVGGVTRQAHADEAVRVDYLAPVGCPESGAFVDRVKERVPSARTASPEELAREVKIVVSEDEDGFAARLDFVDMHGETITRTLSGKTCDEVVTGIALVTALALEAQQGDAAPAAPLEGAETPGDVAPGEAKMPERAVPAVKPVEAPEPRARKSAPPRAKRRARPVPQWLYGTGIGGGNAWYVAPGTPLAFDAGFRVGHRLLTGSGRVGLRSWLSDARVGNRSASFLGFAGALEACPVAWPKESRVRIEPCLGTTLGVLEGSGDQTAELPVATSSRIFWADLRGIARLRLAVTERVELEAQGELGVPLRTHRFDLRAVLVLYEIEGQTAAEIAEITGLPRGTVASRLRRAREEFSEHVKRHAARQNFRAGRAGKERP